MMMAPLQLGTDRTDPLESSRHFDNIHRLLFQLVPVYSNQMSLSFFFSFLRLNVIIMAIVCFFNGKTEEFWPFFAIFHLNRPKFNSFRLFLTLKPKFWLVFDLETEIFWPANPKTKVWTLKNPNLDINKPNLWLNLTNFDLKTKILTNVWPRNWKLLTCEPKNQSLDLKNPKLKH